MQPIHSSLASPLHGHWPEASAILLSGRCRRLPPPPRVWQVPTLLLDHRRLQAAGCLLVCSPCHCHHVRRERTLVDSFLLPRLVPCPPCPLITPAPLPCPCTSHSTSW